MNYSEVLNNGIIFLRTIDIYSLFYCFYWRATCKEAELKSEVLTPAQSKGSAAPLLCISLSCRLLVSGSMPGSQNTLKMIKEDSLDDTSKLHLTLHEADSLSI